MPNFLPNKPPFQEEKSFAMKEWFQSCWRAFRAQNVLAAIQTASFTTDITEYFYPVDTTAGIIVASLPPAANNLGKQYVFKNTTGVNAVTITPSGTDTIDGSATLSLTGVNGAAHIVSDGINKWYRVTVSSSGVVGTAPSDATYVTLSTNGTLTNERVLTAGTGIGLTDAGAGSTVTVASTLIVSDEGTPLATVPTILDFVGGGVVASGAGTTKTITIAGATTDAPVDAQYLTLATNATLTVERVLTAGTNVTFVDGGAGSTLTINASGGSSGLTQGQVWALVIGHALP